MWVAHNLCSFVLACSLIKLISLNRLKLPLAAALKTWISRYWKQSFVVQNLSFSFKHCILRKHARFSSTCYIVPSSSLWWYRYSVSRLFVILLFFFLLLGLSLQFKPTPHTGAFNFIGGSYAIRDCVDGGLYGSVNHHCWCSVERGRSFW